MRQDDRGITLVEVIIAVAVSAIVIGAATLFIRNALKGYEVASNMIDLQVEAQVLMEQLATWGMEGNYYDIKEETISKNDVFFIYHIPREASENLPDGGTGYETVMGDRWVRVFWCDKENRKLYMLYEKEWNEEDEAGNDFKVLNLNPEIKDFTVNLSGSKLEWNLIGDFVEDFDAEKDDDQPNKVTVKLSIMKAGIPEYELEDEINMRNPVHIIKKDVSP